MSGDIQLELYLHQYKMDALEAVLNEEDTSVEEQMQEHLLELYAELVPVETQLAIRDRIDTESAEERARYEANQPVAAFHITESGQEVWLQQSERTEFLHAAAGLRRYLTNDPQKRVASFADTLSRVKSITPEQFHKLALERMENTGRVTGAFEVDLDVGEFSALHIMDGWKTFRVKDITTAAYHAMRKGHLPEEKRLEIFLDRLQGLELTSDTLRPIELQGTRRLLPEDITFGESIEEMDGVLNFYLECWFPVDQVFGTHVETDVNNNYLNVYANYDMATGEVRDELEITLCRGDGADVQMVYKLDGNERAALLEKMRDYCQQQTGQSLEDFAASFQMNDLSESQTSAPPGQTLENGMRVRDILQMDTPYDIFLTCGPEHGHVPLDVLNKLTDSGRETYAALLDSEGSDSRSTGMEIELTLSGITPEELKQFYENYESHQWAEDHMTMYM